MCGYALLLLQEMPVGYEKLGIIGLLIAAVIYLYRDNRDLRSLLYETLATVERIPALLARVREEIRDLREKRRD